MLEPLVNKGVMIRFKSWFIFPISSGGKFHAGSTCRLGKEYAGDLREIWRECACPCERVVWRCRGSFDREAREIGATQTALSQFHRPDKLCKKWVLFPTLFTNNHMCGPAGLLALLFLFWFFMSFVCFLCQAARRGSSRSKSPANPVPFLAPPVPVPSPLTLPSDPMTPSAIALAGIGSLESVNEETLPDPMLPMMPVEIDEELPSSVLNILRQHEQDPFPSTPFLDELALGLRDNILNPWFLMGHEGEQPFLPSEDGGLLDSFLVSMSPNSQVSVELPLHPIVPPTVHLPSSPDTLPSPTQRPDTVSPRVREPMSVPSAHDDHQPLVDQAPPGPPSVPAYGTPSPCSSSIISPNPPSTPPVAWSPSGGFDEDVPPDSNESNLDKVRPSTAANPLSSTDNFDHDLFAGLSDLPPKIQWVRARIRHKFSLESSLVTH